MLKNFNYIIEYGDKQAILVDPLDTNLLSEFLSKNNLKPISVINTHEHFDHIQGNEFFVKNYNCNLYISQKLKNKVSGYNKLLTYDDVLDLGDNSLIKIKETPGHTFGHITLFLYNQNNLDGIITGDSFFNAGVGNCHSGDPETSYKTIKNVYWDLPGGTKVYPGHDYIDKNLKFDLSIEPDNNFSKDLLKKVENYSHGELVTDMDTERKINPFLRLNEKSVIEGVKEKYGLNYTPDEKELFLKIRKLRDRW